MAGREPGSECAVEVNAVFLKHGLHAFAKHRKGRLARGRQIHVELDRAAGHAAFLPRRVSRIIDAPFSPIISEGALVLPLVMDGIIDASTTRKPSMP